MRLQRSPELAHSLCSTGEALVLRCGSVGLRERSRYCHRRRACERGVRRIHSPTAAGAAGAAGAADVGAAGVLAADGGGLGGGA